MQMVLLMCLLRSLACPCGMAAGEASMVRYKGSKDCAESVLRASQRGCRHCGASLLLLRCLLELLCVLMVPPCCVQLAAMEGHSNQVC